MHIHIIWNNEQRGGSSQLLRCEACVNRKLRRQIQIISNEPTKYSPTCCCNCSVDSTFQQSSYTRVLFRFICIHLHSFPSFGRIGCQTIPKIGRFYSRSEFTKWNRRNAQKPNCITVYLTFINTLVIRAASFIMRTRHRSIQATTSNRSSGHPMRLHFFLPLHTLRRPLCRLSSLNSMTYTYCEVKTNSMHANNPMISS